MRTFEVGFSSEADAPCFQLFDEIRVLDRREHVAEPFRSDGERFPDGFGAGGFAGVVGEAQACGLRACA